MSHEPSKKLLEAVRRIAEQAPKDVWPNTDSEFARQELSRYGKKNVKNDDPTVPANKARKLRLDDLEGYYTLRKEFVPKLFGFMKYWICGLAVLVVLSGLQPVFSDGIEDVHWFWILIIDVINWPFRFQLSDSVLIALMGGSTANIIGLFLVVARYLYPKDKPPDAHGF